MEMLEKVAKVNTSEGLIIDIRSEPATISYKGKTLPLNDSPLENPQKFLIRSVDLCGALGSLLLFLPLMTLIVILIRVTSKGPAIYSSRRVAKDSGSFGAYKFRTMQQNADEILANILQTDPAAKAEYKQYSKLKNDPRITKLGKFLRKTNLDELPQLFNVLKGEMSLIGPRPKLPEERDIYEESLPTVLRVKPGMTGLWQISGRNQLTLSDRVMLDVQYATDRSFSSDARICFHTVLQMCRPNKNGAL